MRAPRRAFDGRLENDAQRGRGEQEGREKSLVYLSTRKIIRAICSRNRDAAVDSVPGFFLRAASLHGRQATLDEADLNGIVSHDRMGGRFFFFFRLLVCAWAGFCRMRFRRIQCIRINGSRSNGHVRSWFG